jgi:hypothetical protein
VPSEEKDSFERWERSSSMRLSLVFMLDLWARLKRTDCCFYELDWSQVGKAGFRHFRRLAMELFKQCPCRLNFAILL